MQEPIWLSREAVLAIHQRQLAEHGGLPGVREEGGLEAALARPRQLFAYADPPADLAALASAYAGGLIRNHPFVDGNKRVAWVAARTFMRINGMDVSATQEEKYVAVLSLVIRDLSEDEFADWLRSHAR